MHYRPVGLWFVAHNDPTVGEAAPHGLNLLRIGIESVSGKRQERADEERPHR
jgi:hypothetical protein